MASPCDYFQDDESLGGEGGINTQADNAGNAPSLRRSPWELKIRIRGSGTGREGPSNVVTLLETIHSRSEDHLNV